METVNYFQRLFIMQSILYWVVEYDEAQNSHKFEKDIFTINNNNNDLFAASLHGSFTSALFKLRHDNNIKTRIQV